MVLALGMHHTQAALEAQRAVSEMTNELLRKNAEKLKTATTGVAREAERGILDLKPSFAIFRTALLFVREIIFSTIEATKDHPSPL